MTPEERIAQLEAENAALRAQTAGLAAHERRLPPNSAPTLATSRGIE
jgi:hypothetical protein